jgi:hypothetical protein
MNIRIVIILIFLRTFYMSNVYILKDVTIDKKEDCAHKKGL